MGFQTPKANCRVKYPLKLRLYHANRENQDVKCQRGIYVLELQADQLSSSPFDKGIEYFVSASMHKILAPYCVDIRT